MITSKKNDSEEQMVVLRTFTSDFEANLVRAKLQEAGVPCMLADEFFSSLYPLTTVGTMRLMVFEKDVEKALAILNDAAGSDGSDTPPADNLS